MESSDTSGRIVTLSRRLRRGLWVVLAAIAIAGLIGVVTGGGEVSQGDWFRATLVASWFPGLAEAPLAAKLVALLMVALVLGVYGGMVYQFERLLRLYEKGRILTLANTRRMRNLGLLVLVEPFLMLPGALADLSIQLLSGVEQVTIRFETDQFDLLLFFVGVGIVIVAHVMRLAFDVAEDAALTI